jgi:hypothetical protein
MTNDPANGEPAQTADATGEVERNTKTQTEASS